MTPKKTDLVFVYGTLKRGFYANQLLDGALYMSCGETPPIFSMYGRAFPMAVLSEKGHSMWGEVYSCSSDIMKELDHYEGYPDFYDRARFPIHVPEYYEKFSVRELRCWVYFMRDVPEGLEKTKIKPVEGYLNWGIPF